MKLPQIQQPKLTLPDTQTVCEIIMRLPSPLHIMAWVMAETGCRLADLRMLRVHDFHASEDVMTLCTDNGCRTAELSEGLRAALDDYLYQLRERFERLHRSRVRSEGRGVHMVHSFADQLMFPAWSLHGNERAKRDALLPVSIFTDELLAAAHAVGYQGTMHSNTLRLFCTSRWIEEGADIATIHRRLGHKDLMTTMLMVQALRQEGLAFIPESSEPPRTDRVLEHVA